MDPLEKVEIGKTGLRVTRMGLGCASLAGLYRKVTEEQAISTVHCALDLGIDYFDVAPHYGVGVGESRLGKALAGVPRDSYVISTKVGRLLRPVESSDSKDSMFVEEPALGRVYDFSRDGVLRSLEESLERLNMDHVEILFIHDPSGVWPNSTSERFSTEKSLHMGYAPRAARYRS